MSKALRDETKAIEGLARRIAALQPQYRAVGHTLYDSAQDRWLVLLEPLHAQSLVVSLMTTYRGKKLRDAQAPRRVCYERDGDQESLEFNTERFDITNGWVSMLEAVVRGLEAER